MQLWGNLFQKQVLEVSGKFKGSDVVWVKV